MLTNLMSFLNLNMLQELLKVELNKTAGIVDRICEKEEQVIQHFKRHYLEEKVDIERKAEIYWQLRKSKNMICGLKYKCKFED